MYFPEFEDYQIYEGSLIPEKKTPGVIDAFRAIGSGYQKYQVGDKLKAGGSAALNGLAVAGKFIYNIRLLSRR